MLLRLVSEACRGDMTCLVGKRKQNKKKETQTDKKKSLLFLCLFFSDIVGWAASFADLWRLLHLAGVDKVLLDELDGDDGGAAVAVLVQQVAVGAVQSVDLTFKEKKKELDNVATCNGQNSQEILSCKRRSDVFFFF